MPLPLLQGHPSAMVTFSIRSGFPQLWQLLITRYPTVVSPMRIEDALPALRVGRRARRKVWPAGHHLEVQLIAGVRSEHFTMKGGASEHTWPSSQLESRDMLADDWELLALPAYEAYVPRNFKEAFDIVLSMMSHEVFDPYEDVKKARTLGPDGVRGLKSDCDWREMGRECLSRYLEAASTTDKDARQAALARACMSSLKALSYHLAERYAREVMEW